VKHSSGDIVLATVGGLGEAHEIGPSQWSGPGAFCQVSRFGDNVRSGLAVQHGRCFILPPDHDVSASAFQILDRFARHQQQMS
jgi:hypothetical protein